MLFEGNPGYLTRSSASVVGLVALIGAQAAARGVGAASTPCIHSPFTDPCPISLVLARERAWSGHQVLYDQLNRTFTRLEYLSITTLDSSPSFSCSCASTPLSSLCHYSSMSPSTSQSSLSSLSSYQELALTQDREPTPPLWSWNDMVE